MSIRPFDIQQAGKDLAANPFLASQIRSRYASLSVEETFAKLVDSCADTGDIESGADVVSDSGTEAVTCGARVAVATPVHRVAERPRAGR